MLCEVNVFLKLNISKNIDLINQSIMNNIMFIFFIMYHVFKFYELVFLIIQFINNVLYMKNYFCITKQLLNFRVILPTSKYFTPGRRETWNGLIFSVDRPTDFPAITLI